MCYLISVCGDSTKLLCNRILPFLIDADGIKLSNFFSLPINLPTHFTCLRPHDKSLTVSPDLKLPRTSQSSQSVGLSSGHTPGVTPGVARRPQVFVFEFRRLQKSLEVSKRN